MSISHLLDTGTCPPAWVAVRAHRLHSCTDVQFDRDLIGLIRLNGNIPPGNPRTFLHTNDVQAISWKTFDKEDIPAGADGDYLQTIAGVVEWAPPTFSPSVITPGTAFQIFHTNSTGTSAEWTSSIEIPGTLKVDGSTVLDSNVDCNQVLNVDGNFFSNSNSTLDGVTDILGDLQLNSNSGTTGQVLTKTSLTTQDWEDISVTPSVITPGTSNQVLVTNVGATAANWSNNLSLPGTLVVTGLATCNNGISVLNGSSLSGTTNIINNLQFNGSSGTSGQYLKKTGAATQAFTNIAASDISPGSNGQVLTTTGGVSTWAASSSINVVKYGTTFTVQDLNSAAGPTALSFSTSPYINTATTLPITQPSATQFTIGTTDNYNVIINGYIDPASTGLGNTVVTLSLEVNGTELQTSAIVCSANYMFTGSFSGIAISATQIVRILARRIVGAGTLNTFASGSAIPSFASSIYFST